MCMYDVTAITYSTCFVTYNFILCRSSKTLTMEYKTLGFVVIKNYPTANNRKSSFSEHFTES
jgi:hypothetical protein